MPRRKSRPHGSPLASWMLFGGGFFAGGGAKAPKGYQIIYNEERLPKVATARAEESCQEGGEISKKWEKIRPKKLRHMKRTNNLTRAHRKKGDQSQQLTGKLS